MIDSDIKASHRVGWYDLYSNGSTFEFNPYVTLQQATERKYVNRQPLYSVFISNGEIVVFKNQKRVTQQDFLTFEDAFAWVENLEGYTPPKPKKQPLPVLLHTQQMFLGGVIQMDWTGCLVCSQPLVRHETGRKSKYCSDACKVKAYRQRHSIKPLPNDLLQSKALRNSSINI